MSKQVNKTTSQRAVKPSGSQTAKDTSSSPSHPLLRNWMGGGLFFLMIWAWAWLYYGSVLQMARDYSFWVADIRQMEFIMCQSFAGFRWLGRLLLQLYKFPWLGGLFLAAMLTLTSCFTGYILCLRGKLRGLRHLPALACVGVYTYHGINMFFESETGYILVVPFVVTVVLGVLAAILRAVRGSRPADSNTRNVLMEQVVVVAIMACIIGYNEMQRPYTRTISRLSVLMEDQNWNEMQKVALSNAIQSNRPMACFYAISLLHTGKIAERMYDIRLDYDSLYVHGMDGQHNNCSGMYIPEGSLHAGFIQTCMHNCMEEMVMNGPSIRLLKLLVKSALMRNEWELAEKYLRILGDVPFEGKFCDKYGAMVHNTTMIEADPEFARIRLTEPIHDSFESFYQQPIFMGYNLNLVEGRSMEALTNSLCVCLYTKLMPNFLERLQPIAGATPPEIIADGVLLASTKQPGIEKNFPGLDYRTGRIQSFLQSIQPYMSDRPGHAYELFSKYKGYYPYYYFFGNLKATKKGYTGEKTSSSGVN